MPEYKNPNAGGPAGPGGGGQDNRSFLLMIVVMFGVIFGLQIWQRRHNPQTAAPANTAAVSQPANTPPANGTAAQPSQPVVPGQPGQLNQANQPALANSVQAAAEQQTVVENELYRITFSNRGGEVRSWILKKFTDNNGKPLDMVHDGASQLYGYPLSLYTYDPALTRALSGALFQPSATGTLQAPATLSFHWVSGNLDVTKVFTFGSDYVIHADTQVLRNGAPLRALVAWPAALGDMENAAAYANSNIDLSADGKDDHIAFKKVSGGATLPGPFDFAGVSDQYFAALFLPDKPSDASLVTIHNQIDVNKVQRHTGLGQGTPAKGTALVPALGAGLGDLDGHTRTRLFVGPKSAQVLESVTTATGGTLRPALDFGFWGYIGKFLFTGLQAVHRWIAPAVTSPRDWSWGWAIILFTVLINLVLLPLRIKGMQGMIKMQRIQPQIDAIKKRFGNPGPTDPKTAEMNREVMALQKEHGVSMFGGCVPTLIQLPLLFAFFTMMTRVVELRHSHWGWIPDLSAADPYHILPILMVVTSFLVQFYTPSPGVDPQQQRMMAFMMPAFSGYMTWNYAAGLALYWNVGNFIMIIQQAVMNQTALGQEMRRLQQERAKKKTAPAGKTAGRVIQGRR